MTALDLRNWRCRLNLSQSEAAAALHVPVFTYCNWEAGRRRPSAAIALLTAYVELYGTLQT